MWVGKLNSWAHPFPLSLCPVALGSTKQCFFQSCSKVLYTESLSSVSHWLGVSVQIFCIFLWTIHTTISALSLILRIVSLASLNLVRLESQFQKVQKQFQKLIFNACSFRTTLGAKSCMLVLSRQIETIGCVCVCVCVYTHTNIWSFMFTGPVTLKIFLKTVFTEHVQTLKHVIIH
jgi:hypothetical protein